MRQTHPLPIHHSWPLHDRARHFELGRLHDYDIGLAIADAARGNAAHAGARIDTHRADAARLAPGDAARPGEWSCDLADNRLHWSQEVFAIFGLPTGAAVSRAETAAFYCEPSRAAMERLRAYAIRHRRGFTLDAEIAPATGPRRWMRLIAAPVCEGGEVVRLQGLKFPVPAGE